MTGDERAVLLVDDDADILSSLQAVLEFELPGVRVLTASSGKGALAILQQQPVDLVITDYRMPGMTGMELLRAAQNAAPRARGLLISAFPQEVLSLEAQPTNLAGFIPKPLDVERLLREARQCLDTH